MTHCETSASSPAVMVDLHFHAETKEERLLKLSNWLADTIVVSGAEQDWPEHVDALFAEIAEALAEYRAFRRLLHTSLNPAVADVAR